MTAAAEELDTGEVVLEELLTVITEEELVFTVLDTELTTAVVLEELFTTPELLPGTPDPTEEALLTELLTTTLELPVWLETLETSGVLETAGTLEATGSGVILLAIDEVEPLEPTPPPPPHAPNNNVLLNIRATLKRLQTLADKCIVARALERLNGRLFIANYLECRWWMT